MLPFETLPISLHGCRADEQRESVNEAKPTQFHRSVELDADQALRSSVRYDAEHHFCVVILSMGQDAPMRVK